jgi:CRP/FNR family transcriptional regulator, polysaccharide utilization system transcription regulator
MAKILLIEDNKEMRENTSEILELSGHQVEVAENGKLGFKKAQAHQPDLIICDIMMPELDGYGVLHLVNRDPTTNQIPFIFLTAKADRADIRKGMQMGADDYITKPFDDTELLSAIDVRLKKAEAINASRFNQGTEGFENFISHVKTIDSFAQIQSSIKIKEYKKKEIVYSENNHPNFLYYIEKGKVKTLKSNSQDKEFITGLYDIGDFFGYVTLLEGGIYDDEAIAMEDSVIKLISKDDFLKMIYLNREVANTFMKLLSKEIREKEERLLQIAYNSVRKKVSQSLVLLKDKYGNEENDSFSFPISREDLAHIAGTATETLIRTLTDFKDEGLIEIKGSLITILQYDKLKNMKN